MVFIIKLTQWETNVSFYFFTILISAWNVFQLVLIPSNVAFHNFFTKLHKTNKSKIYESHSTQLSSEMEI